MIPPELSAQPRPKLPDKTTFGNGAAKRRLGARSVGYALFALAIVLTIGGLTPFFSPIKTQLNTWKLLPHPETLTELYFTNPQTIPSAFTGGQTQSVAFTVHNLEYRTKRYHYTIVESTKPGTPGHTLDSGSFVIKHNSYHDAFTRFVLQPLADRVSITITLTNTQESIYYWLRKDNHPRKS